MKKLIKIAGYVFLLSFTLGFRVDRGAWQITKADPTIWIRLCNADFTVEENDMKEEDPLYGQSTLKYSEVIQSVIDDYNSVPTAYLRLALYPDDVIDPGDPETGDSRFTKTKAAVRTIDICFGETDPAAGVSGGYAQLKYDGDTIIGCEIKAKEEHMKKALFLTHLITHEMGHCFSLQHVQESQKSVMSYFGEKKTRLQPDDYAGLTFKYPTDEAFANEKATFGMTGCSPQ